MKNELTIVTCCVCRTTGQAPKDNLEKLNDWFVIHQKHSVTVGSRPYEWWCCSAKDCITKLPFIIVASQTEGSTVEIPHKKEVLRLTCDVCHATAEHDSLNPMVGGNALGGWISVIRNKRSFSDHDNTHWNVCGPNCLQGLGMIT